MIKENGNIVNVVSPLVSFLFPLHDHVCRQHFPVVDTCIHVYPVYTIIIIMFKLLFSSVFLV